MKLTDGYYGLPGDNNAFSVYNSSVPNTVSFLIATQPTEDNTCFPILDLSGSTSGCKYYCLTYQFVLAFVFFWKFEVLFHEDSQNTDVRTYCDVYNILRCVSKNRLYTKMLRIHLFSILTIKTPRALTALAPLIVKTLTKVTLIIT